tara:strand:- start:983 stop:1189 length:207 start_codon:yes stop_codon:yes gene_type:complete
MERIKIEIVIETKLDLEEVLEIAHDIAKDLGESLDREHGKVLKEETSVSSVEMRTRWVRHTALRCFPV